MKTTRPHARLRRRWAAWTVLLLFVALVTLDQAGLLLVRRSDDLMTYHGVHARVQRVIDGDTFEIALPDPVQRRSATRIVLWGVNCPEPARGDAPAQAWADEATAFTASQLAESTIILWLESHQTRDGFGRVPAHVELPDGSSLNEQLLAAGLARVDAAVPHSMLTRYAQAEWSARRQQRGIWLKPAP